MTKRMRDAKSCPESAGSLAARFIVRCAPLYRWGYSVIKNAYLLPSKTRQSAAVASPVLSLLYLERSLK